MPRRPQSAVFRSRAVIPVLAVIAAGSLASVLQAASQESPAKLLGPETVLYLEVADPDALIDRATDPRLQALYRTVPEVRDALDNDELRELRQVAGGLADALGTTWEDGLRMLVGGGIAIGVEEALPPRVVTVVTPTDPDFLKSAHEKLLEFARQDAEANGKPDPVKQKTYRGVTGYATSDEEAHAILDGQLVIVNGGKALKAVIDRHLDGGATLAESSEYLDRRPDPIPTVWAYARLERLREIDPKRFAMEEPDPGAWFLAGAWIETAQKAAWTRATLDWTEDRFQADLTIPRPADGLSEPLRRFLPPKGDGAPRALPVKGTIASIQSWRDFAALWEVREELLPPEALQGLAQLDTFAGQFFGGRDFEDAVLEPLGAHWQLIVAEQDHEAMDPKPDLELPAFALVLELDPKQPEFAQRLSVAFQSFVGLANLGAAQTGAPPLLMGSDLYDGVTIAKATFMDPPESGDAIQADDEPAGEVHYRRNYSPSIAHLENHFIVSSSVDLTKRLIDALRSEPAFVPTASTIRIELQGARLAKYVERNRERLILQNMVEEGNDRAAAETQVDTLAALLQYVSRGVWSLEDTEEHSRIALEFQFGQP